MNTFKKMKSDSYRIGLICLFTVGSSVAFAQSRSTQDFDNNWKFILDSTHNYSEVNVKDNNWRTLNLPHDWSIEGTFSKDNPAGAGGGALPGGIGWYRKTFTIPATDKGRSVFIRFDGVYKNSEVWINGKSLGIRPNGYITFQYDLTPYLKYGNEKNIIAVKVDNSKQPNSRWYSGSGIFRNVWMITVDKLHVDKWGTFISTPKVSEKAATVNVVTQIKNQYSSAKDIVLKTTLYDASGKEISTSSKKAAIPESGDEKGVSLDQSFTVNNPNL